MELQAAQVEAAVAQRHHLALRAQGDGLEARGQRGGVDHPGVVASDGEFRRQAGEQVILRRAAAGRLHAVEDIVQVDERAAEGLAERLLAQADAQDGLLDRKSVV